VKKHPTFESDVQVVIAVDIFLAERTDFHPGRPYSPLCVVVPLLEFEPIAEQVIVHPVAENNFRRYTQIFWLECVLMGH